MEDATPIEGGCVTTHPNGSRACLSFVSTWMTLSLNKQSRFRDMNPFLTAFIELLSLRAWSEEHLPPGTTMAFHTLPLWFLFVQFSLRSEVIFPSPFLSFVDSVEWDLGGRVALLWVFYSLCSSQPLAPPWAAAYASIVRLIPSCSQPSACVW